MEPPANDAVSQRQQAASLGQLPPRPPRPQAQQQPPGAQLVAAAQLAGLNLPLLGVPGADPNSTLRISVSNGADAYAFRVPLAAVVFLQQLCQLARPPPAAAPAGSGGQPATPAAHPPAGQVARGSPGTPIGGAAAGEGPEARGPPGAAAAPPPDNPSGNGGGGGEAAAAAAAADGGGGGGAQPWCYVVDVTGALALRLHVPATEAARQVLQQLHSVRCGSSARARPPPARN